MITLRASKTFAALILTGCGSGVMPCSTNEIARIPFQCRILEGFFCERLLLLRFHKFKAKLVLFVQFSYHMFDMSGFRKLTFLFLKQAKYSSVLVSIKTD